MNAIRIRKYKLTNRGTRGLSVMVPRIQAQDMGVSAGDELSMYKAVLDGKPIILLANSDEAVLDFNREFSMQGRELAGFIASARVAKP